MLKRLLTPLLTAAPKAPAATSARAVHPLALGPRRGVPAIAAGSMAVALVGAAGLGSCRSTAPAEARASLPYDQILEDVRAIGFGAKAEEVVEFAELGLNGHPTVEIPKVQLERVTTAVPWPRGLVFADDELIALARGRHRNSGGVDRDIDDKHGTLFAIDPDVTELVVEGETAGEAVRANGRVFAEPGDVFNRYEGVLEPADDFQMDRPYCTLIWDEVSRNFFICGYSGVDLPGRKFRKNATDSVHRLDLRSGQWESVEMHDADVVPQERDRYVVSNEYYPHHDPQANAAPHGWLNGPDGGCVARDGLFVAAKDNHLVVRYDLTGIREDAAAGAPGGEPVLGPRVTLRLPSGEQTEVEALGPSAITYHGDYLYVGYRTSSVVLRYELDERGELVQPPVAELVALFTPWDPQVRRSTNLIDMAFNAEGELFVSCSSNGLIWKVGHPDPSHPFRGDTRDGRRISAEPYLELTEHTGRAGGVGNIVFDEEGRLYFCSGNYDTDSTTLAGVIYRAVPLEQ